MQLTSISSKYPVFVKTCELLRQSFFYKDIETLIERTPIDIELAEKMCTSALILCGNDWGVYEGKLNNLYQLNMDFLKLQAELERTGKYKYSSFKEVEEAVFFQEDGSHGVGYLWGLYFSQIFWVIHHRLLHFFLNDFVLIQQQKGIVLEVPVGSGVFLASFLEKLQGWQGVGLDLSESAVNMSSSLFRLKGFEDVEVLQQDFLMYESDNRFDAIICGELIEHVEDPLLVLRKIHTLLNEQGKVFLTTVVWAAGIDHIYLYKSANEIRCHLQEAGFLIEKELIQPVFEKDKNRLDEERVALNYAAVLVKQI